MLQIALLVSLIVILSACTSAPLPPTHLITQAEAELLQAQNLGAQQFAPMVWQDAQNHWQQGLDFMQARDYRNAQFALEKALADAQLASAKSQFERLQKNALPKQSPP